jgi:hypothetical protein
MMRDFPELAYQWSGRLAIKLVQLICSVGCEIIGSGKCASVLVGGMRGDGSLFAARFSL